MTPTQSLHHALLRNIAAKMQAKAKAAQEKTGGVAKAAKAKATGSGAAEEGVPPENGRTVKKGKKAKQAELDAQVHTSRTREPL